MNDNNAPVMSQRALIVGALISIVLWGVVIGATILVVTSGARRIHDAQSAIAKLQHRIPEVRP